VGQGLVFAVKWSEHQGFIRGGAADDLVDLLSERLGFLRARDFARRYRSMSRSKLAKIVAEDKKLTDKRHMNFVFLQAPGSPLRKEVTLESLLTETQRQGWTAL
jgi:3-dehydroquinate synthetase